MKVEKNCAHVHMACYTVTVLGPNGKLDPLPDNIVAHCKKCHAKVFWVAGIPIDDRKNDRDPMYGGTTTCTHDRSVHCRAEEFENRISLRTKDMKTL
jgi:hypothetical protein